MLYPIWQPLPRPSHFPQDPKLDWLLASNFDPRLDYFELRMFRRNARDLRKGLFGPKGSATCQGAKACEGSSSPAAGLFG
jgi:hypothetical protein